MTHAICRVLSLNEVAENIFVLTVQAPEVAAAVRPGQFINVRVAEGTDPLLRRPFSVYRTERDQIEIIFNVVGKGSSALRRKRPGDTLDILGPLGVPFSFSGDDFDTAVLVGGGLGVAPFPLATQMLRAVNKKIVTYLGARTAAQLVPTHLDNVHVATDDGSKGFHGTVVELLTRELEALKLSRPKIFACGPTKMLHALAAVAMEKDIPAEVSLEGPMACGFGICQGCPVELMGGEKKYALMCKDGPTFDVRRIKL
jgi:dihydroorotate dehydrogenase electron transfer subunit